MRKRAKLYQTCILAIGLLVAVSQSLQWASSASSSLFLSYLSLTVITSLLRLGVPTAAGTISIGFIFILASIAQLHIGQTLVIGIAGTISHCLRDQEERIDWLSLAFQTAVVVLGIEAASAAYNRISVILPESGLAAALPLTGTVLFLVTAFPLAATTALSEGELLRRVWQSRFLWSLPYYLAGAALAGLLTAIVHLPWWQTAVMIIPLLLLVYRAYGLQIDSLRRERQHAEELAAIQLGMVEALALAVESKDNSAMHHLHRMATYSVGLGRELGLREEQLKALRAAAVLHDIGQVAVPDHIMMKPGRLTPEEYERLKVHPDVGGDIIDRANFPFPVGPIVRAHHEHWDGSGYPRGLKGERIPIEARVLSAVDTLVALTSERKYRRALSLEKAMEVVRTESGCSLDPIIVSTLERIYTQLEEDARQTIAATLRSPASSNGTQQQTDSKAQSSTDRADFMATIAAARQEEQSVLEFTQLLGNSLNLQETMLALARRFHRIIPYDTMVLYLLRDGCLDAAFHEGQYLSLFHGVSMRLGDGVSGAAAATRKPLLNAGASAEPFAKPHPTGISPLHSALAIPLEGPNGVIGVLTFYSELSQAFRPSHINFLLAIAPKLVATVENSLRYHEAEDQAVNDFLTGLPNAGSLFVRLQNEVARCARSETTLTVLVCDLDGFKQVNDRFGHLTGNKLLQAVGQGLRENCREYDFVARLGGDEFVVLLPGATEEAITTRRRRLRLMVEQAGEDLCSQRVVSLSIGTSTYPVDGRTAEELLAQADSRMYEDKSFKKALRAPVEQETAHSQRSTPTPEY